MAAHSPGPWVAAPYSSVVGAPIVASNGRVVGHTQFSLLAGLPQWYHDECEANRRVLGAAPDMLAALKMAAEVLVQDDTPMVYAQVMRAIAKAEGRT